MTRRADLFDVPIFARPAGAPAVHFENPFRALLAHHRRKLFVADASSSLQGILQMEDPIIRLLLPNRRGHGHLSHDGGAASPNQALVEQQDGASLSGRRNGRIHTRPAGSNHQHIGAHMRHSVS